MRLSINDDCDFSRKGEKATGKLLARLIEHHDYTVPYQFVTKAQVIEIRAEPEESVPVEIGILPVPEGVLTIDAIKRVVCTHFGISHSEMISPRRDLKVQRPRMVAMYFSYKLTSFGFPTIGKRFRRDHTTAMYSIRKMEGMLMSGQDPILRDVEYLRGVLSA